LSDAYKEDYLLLATESLIKAVEARLDRKPGVVQDALKEGYILTPYFAEALPVYEKQEQAMLLYYTEMVQAIDLLREDKRLTGVEFGKPSERPVVKTAPPPAPAPLAGAAKTMEDAEYLYTTRELESAKKLYLAVLEQTDKKPMHAAAYYGLARIAAMQKDPESAERLFAKTLELEPDAPVKAWALVYLGKLSLAAGDREQASKHFQSALGVAGASKMARDQAEQGVQQSSKQ